jgi:hypothetical protein
VRWDALAEVALMTTSRGPFEEDVYFVLTYDDGSNSAIPLGEAADLLPRLQELPDFDNETLWAFAAWTYSRFVGRRVPSWQQLRWSAPTALALTLVWFVVRNLGFGPFPALYV